MTIDDKIKKIAKSAIVILTIIALVFILYMIVVFFDFVSDIELIYSKINRFAAALNTSKETDIVLGGEEEVKPDEEIASIILDRNGRTIAQFALDRQKLVSLNELPFFIPRGFIIIEDNQFFRHKGVNLFRVSIAFVKNIFTFGRSAGGSTITQQLAKILFTKQKRNIKRKIYELYCTIGLESKFNKNEILQIYLNSIYLGHGVYGIANASQFYFGKDVTELNIAEAALLIGMNRAPERYSPIKSKDNAKRIQKVVLNQFVKNGFLTKEESEFEYNKFWDNFEKRKVSGNQSFWKTDINRSGYITEHIRQILETEFSFEKITKGGLIVETTIDIERQILAEDTIRRQLKNIRERIKNANDKLKEKILTDSEIEALESSFASIDYKSGEVLALVGGKEYSFSNQLNRALYSYRPIGSTVKPFVYAIALEEKKLKERDFHPFSKFKDEIRTYIINGKKYQPKNFDVSHKYGDTITIYDAVKKSLNTIAIEIFDQMTEEEKDKVVDFIQKAALLNDKELKRVPNVLSLALGVCELSSFELACAYSVFVRGGKTISPVIIKKIYDKKGNVYYDYARDKNLYFDTIFSNAKRENIELISPQVAYEIVELLRSVFEEGGTGWWAKSASGLTGDIAGKSGTSQDFRDGWFVGFTDKEVTACWVGLDNNKPMLVAGASSAAYIWAFYHTNIASSDVLSSIPTPDKMSFVNICRDSGLIATKKCPNKINFYLWSEGPIPEKCYLHSDFDF